MAGWKYLFRTTPQAIPLAPDAIPPLSITTISLLVAFPFFFLSFSAKCHAVLKPWIPAPIMTNFAFLEMPFYDFTLNFSGS